MKDVPGWMKEWNVALDEYTFYIPGVEVPTIWLNHLKRKLMPAMGTEAIRVFEKLRPLCDQDMLTPRTAVSMTTEAVALVSHLESVRPSHVRAFAAFHGEEDDLQREPDVTTKPTKRQRSPMSAIQSSSKRPRVRSAMYCLLCASFRHETADCFGVKSKTVAGTRQPMREEKLEFIRRRCE